MVQDGEHDRLEHERLGEVALDRADGRPGEEQLALGVGADGSREPIGRQVLERRPPHDTRRGERLELLGSEAEASERLGEAADAGEHAEATSGRQASREDLEDGTPPRDTGAERGLDHGELVVIRVEGAARAGKAHRESS